jgi:hypothetical protein
LQKNEADAANFSVAIDGVTVAPDLSNLGTSGANARLFESGPLSGDGPHTLTITKIGAIGQLDIGNARVGYDFSALYAAIKAYESVEGADLTDEVYLNALEVYTSPVSSQAAIDMAASVLPTKNGVLNYSINGGAVVNIKVAATSSSASIFIAAYNDAGLLTKLWHGDAAAGVSGHNVNLSLAGASKVKVFLWDSDFVPLCEVKDLSY